MRPHIYVLGIVLLIAAGLCRFVVAPRYTERIPPGWEWHAKFLGASSYPDEKTGQFPAKDPVNYYERLITIVDEKDRPHAVVLSDRYVIYDQESGKPSWEYITTAAVDPATGEHVAPEFAGSVALFPRDTEKKTYIIRSNYLKGIPVEFQHEEMIDGLATYVFSYRGRAEWTESYSGTPDYSGIKVEPGQEIRAGDDAFYLRLWVEPVTGGIVKWEEASPAGDWIYDIATGKKLTPVMRWSGGTAGDEVAHRHDRIRSQRRLILWLRDYLPLLLAAGSLLFIVVAFRSRPGYRAKERPDTRRSTKMEGRS